MPEVFFHPGAKEDYADAYSWYHSRSETAAAAFEQAFESALQEIIDAPSRWHPLGKRHRSHLLTTFPYQVIYRQTDTQIVIIAVAHARRRTSYWADRD